MKTLILVILLSLFSSGIIASEWKYNLRDVMQEKVSDNGEKTYHADLKVIDYYLDRISSHAKNYPPKFKNDREKKEIEDKFNQLIGLMEIIGENQQDNPDYLLRMGYAYSMGHNLDLEGSAKKAIDNFERILKRYPDHPQANYLYGMFLSSTYTLQKQSIPYLEKAISSGIYSANYSLGLVYVFLEDKDQAMKYLEKYLEHRPDDKVTKQMIEAVKKGEIKRQIQ